MGFAGRPACGVVGPDYGSAREGGERGFMDKTLAKMQPRPAAVGIGYAHGFLPLLEPSARDVALDAMLTEEAVAWGREG
ncbi:hypothetical protein DBR42_05885 [Pelomonas sp. HMWF004]|nr:hypothetical protein DBR42_05885 [Pelomonas sp. HMWF004]